MEYNLLLQLWKIYQTYYDIWAERWTLKKKDEMLMNKTEIRMLRWIQGVSLRDQRRNEEIREAATVQPITHLMQKRLRWYGHARRRDDSHISHMTRTVLDMGVQGVRSRGRPKLRYMNTIRRDIKKNCLTDVNILERNDWRMAVSRATHWRGRAFKVRKYERPLPMSSEWRWARPFIVCWSSVIGSRRRRSYLTFST